MKIIISISTICLMFAAVMGNAQHVAMPVLSFVADDAHQLRPLVGIAGSASVGAKLDIGVDVVQAAIPPQHEYVLATTGEDRRTVFVDLRASVLSPQSISTMNCESGEEILLQKGRASQCAPYALTGIDRIALSPTGSAALMFNAAQNRLYAFNNLLQSPSAAGTYNLGRLGSVSAFAISDDGWTVAVAVSDGNSGALFLMSPYSRPQQVASLRHSSSISFMHQSQALIVADDGANTVQELGKGEISVLAGANDGVSEPVGIGVSNDNQKVFVGNSGTGSVLTIGLETPSLVSTDCHCAIAGLYPTKSDGVFRITDFSGAPLVLFDGASATPRLTFAPVNPQ